MKSRRTNRIRKYFRPRVESLEGRCLLSGISAMPDRSFGLPGDVLTYHNDNSSTGQNLSETTLTPSNVNPVSFGKLFTDPVDGFVYGQPLTVSHVPIPGRGTHNVVFVTTEHDSVYAFDADNGGAPLWKDSFINPSAGITTVPSAVTLTTDIVPEVGITATPVIDGSTGTLYVVAKTQNVESDGTHYVLTLHALDITSGAEKFGGPVTIADTIFNSSTNTFTFVRGPTVPGTGDNSVNGIVHMNALRENVRSALTLSNGVVYLGVTSHGDNQPYNGWLLGFNASKLRPVSVFNTAPNGSENAIWMSGGKPVVDSNGNIYVATGNGTFDAVPTPGGVQSLGAAGGGLGYQGILNSVAVTLRAFNSPSTGLGENGQFLTPNDLSGTGIDFNAGAQASPPHVFSVTLSYSGTTLTETLKDVTANSATVTETYRNVNIGQLVGGNTAFVGFTGGTGGLDMQQDVKTWTFSNGTTTIDHSGGFASNSDLQANGSASFTSGLAQLTPSNFGQAGSIFAKTVVNVTAGWTTTFTFQMVAGTNPVADGMTFTIQANPGSPAGPDFGDSVIKLAPNGSTVTDFFTPFNQAALSAVDEDLGSGGVLLLPDSAGSSAHPHLLVAAGKDGTIYLIDRENMGKFNSSFNDVVQQLPGAIPNGGSMAGAYDSPAYHNGAIYYLGVGDVLRKFLVANGLLSTSPAEQTSTVFDFPGATPSISANGTSDGIVWVLNNSTYGIPKSPTASPAVLYAYDANTLQELYNSNDVAGDQPGNAVKFTVPTVSHGHVYVGSQGSFSVYGLLPSATSPPDFLQTNLVSDLPGVAQFQDPHLVNPWGISESGSSPFWVSDNNAGVSTLYNAPANPAAGQPPFSINPLVVSIPTPGNPLGATGAPTGTVFNIDGGATGGFTVSGVDKNGKPITASAIFLFVTEDGTLVGWNPAVNPKGFDPAKAGTYAIIAVDNSGNNFTQPDPLKQTGAVYKGMSIASSLSPIFAGDPSSTTVLYAANFRSGKIEVYDPSFKQVTLPAGAFRDASLPSNFAPFNVQVLDDKVYVSYAQQNAAKHDDVGGAGHGFVDVFNLDGTPGLPGGQERLVSRGALDSPWGLAIAPSSFGTIANDLLVGNFKSGFIDIYNPATGQFLGQLKDPDGEPINIDHLWALKVGNGGNGGRSDTVYFTAGIDNEMHGLFGSLTPVRPGTPEGPAEAEVVIAALDVVQLDVATLMSDFSTGASQAKIAQDTQTLNMDFSALVLAEQQFAQDGSHDHGMATRPARAGARHAPARQDLDRLFAQGWSFDT
jgi:uncharacterized protein (TIGR03118 family)